MKDTGKAKDVKVLNPSDSLLNSKIGTKTTVSEKSKEAGFKKRMKEDAAAFRARARELEILAEAKIEDLENNLTHKIDAIIHPS